MMVMIDNDDDDDRIRMIDHDELHYMLLQPHYIMYVPHYIMGNCLYMHQVD